MSDMLARPLRRPTVLAMQGLAVSLSDGALLLDGITLTIAAGDSFGLVGEAGSGKSLLLDSILGTLQPGADLHGQVQLPGHNGQAGGIGYIPTDPDTAFSPLYRLGAQLVGNAAALKRLVALCHAMGIAQPQHVLASYPHQLGLGLRQRVLAAAALAAEPALLLADDPTRQLDHTTQRDILALLRQLTAERGVALLLASRDLGVVASVCDDAAVLYAGRVVEQGPTVNLLADPRHPFTRMLLASHPERASGLLAIPGHAPASGALPSGCRFHPRCPLARPVCRSAVPELYRLFDGSRVACPWHHEALPEMGLG